MSLDQILVPLQKVALGLEELLSEVVFVGGATVPFYLDHPESEEIRVTDDVDIVFQIFTYIEYSKLEEKLLAKGFSPDMTSKIAVRKKFQGIIVDVMPTNADIWGFCNRWYLEGVKRSVPYQLPGGLSINILSLSYFLATKLEAHNDRGESLYISKDMEDVSLILNGSSRLPVEIKKVDPDLRNYLADNLRVLKELPAIDLRRFCECYRVDINRILASLDWF